MGLLSWLRSHRSGEDTAPAPTAAAGMDSSTEPGGSSTQPAPVPAWRTLPHIQRTTTTPALLTDPAGFRAGLHDQRGTAVTGQLGHLVSPQAPAGLAHGLITAPAGPKSTMDSEHQSVQRVDFSARNAAQPGDRHTSVTATAPPAVALQRIERAPLTHAAAVDMGTHRLPTVEPAEPTDVRPSGRSNASSGTTERTSVAAAPPSDDAVEPEHLELDPPRTVELPTVAPERAEPPTVQTTPSTAPTSVSSRTGPVGRPQRQGLGEPLSELPPTVTTVQRAVAGDTVRARPEPPPTLTPPPPPPAARPAEPSPVAPAQPVPDTGETTVVPLSFHTARMSQLDLPSDPPDPAVPAEPPYSAGAATAEPTIVEPPVGDIPVQRLDVTARPTASPPRGDRPSPPGLSPADTAHARPEPDPVVVAPTVPATAPLLGETILPPSVPATDPHPVSSDHAGGPGPADLGAPIQRTTVEQPPPSAEPAPVVAPLLAQRTIELLATPTPTPSDPFSAPLTMPPPALPSTVPDPAPEPAVARLRWESPADVDRAARGPASAPDTPSHATARAVPDSAVMPSGTVQRSAVPRSGGSDVPAARSSAGGSAAVLQQTTTIPGTTTFSRDRGVPTGLVDAGAVAVASGIAQRMADGSVVFTPPGTVQRAPDESAVPSPEPTPAQPPPPSDTPPAVPQDASPPPAGQAPAPDGADPAHPAGGAATTPTVTDELVRSLFGPLSRLLKAELRLERERAGHLIQTRH